MIGEYVMTEADCAWKRKAEDPIGLGSYTMDSHNTQRYVDPTGTRATKETCRCASAGLTASAIARWSQICGMHESAGAGLHVGDAHRVRLDPHGAGLT